MSKVGLVGLGLVGQALAARFLAAGHHVIGFDVVAAQRESLMAAGGEGVDSATAVAQRCETIFLSLPDADVVTAVIDSVEPALEPGRLIVDTTTGDPWRSEALGDRLAARKVHLLEATIAGSSAQVREGQVTVMVGGERPAFERAQALLSTFARETFYVGGLGSASRMKLVVNLVIGLNRAALAEAIALAESLELDPRTALEILQTSPAYSRAMDAKGHKMLNRDFSPQARLSQHLKDVRLILSAAERTGASVPLSLTHRVLLEQAEAAGYGDEDNSAILMAYSKKSKPDDRPES